MVRPRFCGRRDVDRDARSAIWIFDWAEFLHVADLLLTRIDGEAAERSAIRRAYYAGYGRAWEYARSNGAVHTGTGSDHRTVWHWYAHGHSKGVVHVGAAEYGNRLKRWRIKADYDADFGGTAAAARNAISTARLLLQELETLPSSQCCQSTILLCSGPNWRGRMGAEPSGEGSAPNRTVLEGGWPESDRRPCIVADQRSD